MIRCYRVDQLRALDRHAITVLGVPGYTLMCRAAEAALAALRRRWPAARRLHLLCGPGNNGGDGYVLARLALAEGWRVSVEAVDARPPQAGDALRAFEDFRAAGGRLEAPGERLPEADLRVDAALGTGLTRPLAAGLQARIDRIDADPAPVLALDVPSGLCADTGRTLGRPPRAALTVTFVAHKRGLFTGRARQFVGALELATLGLPPALLDTQAAAARIAEPADLAAALPARARDAHKGQHGRVVLLGGAAGMAGAIRLAAEAAARAGAGWVEVLTTAEHVSAVLAGRPELMPSAIEDPDQAVPRLTRASVVAIGPGLGRSAWARGLLASALNSGRPLVLDADALHLLAERPQPLPVPAVLTPHPGEAARLLGQSVEAVEADRWAAAEALARRYQACIVLKGAGTVVAAPASIPWVCAAGNPGMASAGMGDVLCGLIAGLWAQRLGLAGCTGPLAEAQAVAVLAVELHARAGDRAARDGERGLLAGDLFAPLRGLLNPCRTAAPDDEASVDSDR